MADNENTTPAPRSTQRPGWSNAARRRAANGRPPRRSGGLSDTVTYAGNGFTEYADELIGTGTVQIWDES